MSSFAEDELRQTELRPLRRPLVPCEELVEVLAGAMSLGKSPGPLKGPFVGLLLSVFGIMFDICLVKTGTL